MYTYLYTCICVYVQIHVGDTGSQKGPDGPNWAQWAGPGPGARAPNQT